VTPEVVPFRGRRPIGGQQSPSVDIALLTFPKAAESLRVEVARTLSELTTGLQWRSALGENEGLVLAFPRRALNSVWMRHVLISLDVVFLDGDEVVGILPSVAKWNDQILSIKHPSTSILEVNGGWCARHQVTVGQRVRIG
jgi:uncharacterized membrane protein (UPF0127 family)